jgi:hypothetical protein
MTIKLNFWQTLALFLPFIISLVFLEIPHSNLYSYQTNFAIANLLSITTLFVVILYQTNLVLSFNNQSGIKSQVFKWNAFVPLIFITLYLLDVGYSTFNSHVIHSPQYNAGPLRKTDFNGLNLIIMFFLLHSFITFYFINNLFVSKKTKLIQDDSQREQLKSDFLMPMKRLTKISIWVIVVFFTLSTIIDIVRYSNIR